MVLHLHPVSVTVLPFIHPSIYPSNQRVTVRVKSSMSPSLGEDAAFMFVFLPRDKVLKERKVEERSAERYNKPYNRLQ